MADEQTWRFPPDDAWAKKSEARRIASDERTRIALSKIRRIDDVLPGFEGHPYLDLRSEMDGFTVLVRIYDPTYELED